MASRFLYFNYQSSDKYLSRQLWKNVQVRCLSFLDGCRLYATIVKHNFSTVKAEYEHPVSGVCAFCCLFLILFPPPIYVLESCTVPNLRLWFINKVKMSCQTSLIQSNKRHLFGSPFMDKFAVEICSGKLKHIFFRWLLKGYCFTGLPRFPPMSSLLKQKQYCEKSKNKCHLSNHELNFCVQTWKV